MDESFDENGMLTEFGRKAIEFALRNESYSKQLFEGLRIEVTDKINAMKELIIQTSKQKGLTENERAIMKFMFEFVSVNYRDHSHLNDFIEIVNDENLRIKNIIKQLVEEITKNKTLSDDSINVIIEMVNKIDESHKFTDQQLQDLIKEFRSTLKFTKRKYEDEAQDTEKSQDVKKSEDE